MRYMSPVSFSLQLEKSNFFNLLWLFGSDIKLAKYARTSSPKKFLLHVKT